MEGLSSQHQVEAWKFLKGAPGAVLGVKLWVGVPRKIVIHKLAPESLLHRVWLGLEKDLANFREIEARPWWYDLKGNKEEMVEPLA